MSYIGTPPSNAFTSLLKQDFSTSATTGYTLDHAVNNANDIALFINFVRQEPTAGYAASGTTLTLTSATASSDDMYCVYLGQALQTVNPPNVSVGTAQLIDGAVTSAKLASGAVANTPAFSAFLTNSQTLSTNTWTKLSLDNEQWDTDSAFDSSTNYRFTVPSGEGGKYLFTYAGGTESLTSTTLAQIALYKNGSFLDSSITRSYPTTTTGGYPHKSIVLDLSVGNYIELYGQHTKGSNCNFDPRYTFLQAQKLIGV